MPGVSDSRLAAWPGRPCPHHALSCPGIPAPAQETTPCPALESPPLRRGHAHLPGIPAPAQEAPWSSRPPPTLPLSLLQGILRKIGCCYSCEEEGKSRLPSRPCPPAPSSLRPLAPPAPHPLGPRSPTLSGQLSRVGPLSRPHLTAPTPPPFLCPDSCRVRVNRTVLRHQGCEAPVNMTFCEGPCPGVSK